MNLASFLLYSVPIFPIVDIDPPVRSRKYCEFKMLNAKVLDANRKML